ncbi:MAG: cyanophycin synthetase, partial [Cyanobacteria bacterium P01_D01_bin.56]
WSYFAAQSVDIAVIEVGLGGRLDATNVCSQPLVTAIVSLSREHWQRLGPTLADIAREKAGVIKPKRPVVIGPLPQVADDVVRKRAMALDAPVYAISPAEDTPTERWRGGLGNAAVEYVSGLLGEHQRVNSAIAIAILQLLQQQGWNISTSAIQKGMAQTQWPGRLQWLTWQGQSLLIDGAHNPAAAQMLRRYVEQLPQPVTWLMGMLATKDHKDIFQALLRPGDTLYLVPVAGHLTAEPAELAKLAQTVCPTLSKVDTQFDLEKGLENLAASQDKTKVFCGSLYLIGEFLSQLKT